MVHGVQNGTHAIKPPFDARSLRAGQDIHMHYL